MTSTDPIEHPGLADALAQLAEALDRRSAGAEAPSHLAMGVLADHISQQVHELTRSLVGLARSEDRATWAEVGQAFGVTRQAALRRWRTGLSPARSKAIK